jgi:hypothetical protein
MGKYQSSQARRKKRRAAKRRAIRFRKIDTERAEREIEPQCPSPQPRS